MLRLVLLFGLIGGVLAGSLWLVGIFDADEGNPVAQGPRRGMSDNERARRASAPGRPRAASSAGARAGTGKEQIRALVANDNGRALPFFRAWVARAEELEPAQDGSLAIPAGMHPIEGRDGKLVVFGLEPGPWKLRVGARGHVAASLDVEVPTERPLEIELQRTAGIVGRVELGSGVPAIGAQVGIGPQDGPLRWFDLDDRGAFEIPNIKPGSIEVTARVEGREERAAPLSLTLGSGEQRSELVLRLAAQGWLTGELLETIDDRLGRAVIARRFAGGEPYRTVTDETGRFDFTLPIGRYRVMLEWSEGVDGSGDWVVGYAQRHEVEGTVEKGSTSHLQLGRASPEAVQVSGRILDAGKPLADTIVRAYPALDTHLTTVDRTDAEGRFELTLPTPGSYELSVGQLLENQIVFAQEVAPQERLELDLRLPQGRVRGSVRSAQGAIEGAVVKLIHDTPAGTPPSRGDVRTTRTFEDGSYEIDHVTPGLYHLRVVGPEAGTGQGLGMKWIPDLVVAPKRVLRDVRALLQPAAVVRGSVRDARGAPVVDAPVQILDEAGHEILSPGTITTDDQGRFVHDGMGAGTFHVRVEVGYRVGERRVVLLPGEEATVQLSL